MTTLNERKNDLNRALLAAFPTVDRLVQFCALDLGVALNTIAVGDLSSQVFQLVEWSFATGRTDELFQKALESVPGNPALRTLAEEVQFKRASTPPSAFVRGNLATNMSIVSEVILEALPMLVSIKPNYVIVSVLATNGGQIEKIVDSVSSLFSQANGVDFNRSSNVDRLLSNAGLLFTSVRAIYVRVLAEGLDIEETGALTQICDGISLLMTAAERNRPPNRHSLTLHLSIRPYRSGDWSALRGITISVTDNVLRERSDAEDGHYEMGAANLVAATMGPRDLIGQPMVGRDFGYDIFTQNTTDRSDVWMAYMARLFEHFWNRSDSSIFHRVVRAT